MSHESRVASLELHGFLADRLLALGRRRGTRTVIDVRLNGSVTVAELMNRLVAADPRYGLLYNTEIQALPEHVEAVLNDRVLDLQGGVNATVGPGDTLSFLPAHAGG